MVQKGLLLMPVTLNGLPNIQLVFALKKRPEALG